MADLFLRSDADKGETSPDLSLRSQADKEEAGPAAPVTFIKPASIPEAFASRVAGWAPILGWNKP